MKNIINIKQINLNNTITVLCVLFLLIFANNSTAQLSQYIMNQDDNMSLYNIKNGMEIYLDSLESAQDSSTFFAEGGEYNEYMKFMYYWEMRLMPHGDFNRIFDADSIQIDELFDIADNLNTTAGIYARNMLVLMGEMEYYEPVYFPEIFKAQPIFGYNRDRNKQKTSFLKIFPNPANDYFTAETKIDKDFKEAYLVLVTINGKEMKRVELRKKRNQLIIPTNNISIGTYVLKLVVNDGIIESKKVIIIK